MQISPQILRKKLNTQKTFAAPEIYRKPYAQHEINAAIPAAVLVALQSQPDGLHILLTKRSPQLSDHAGQISFVGGRVDATDTDSRATALREAEEEIGLTKNHVEILATLQNILIARKYLVTPHVALIEPFTPKIDLVEVEELFSVPLEFVLEDSHCLPDQRFVDYNGYQFQYKEKNIWGGTASILLNLKKILKNAA